MELLKSIFSGVLTMSLKAIPVILLVLLLRFALRRAPKRWPMPSGRCRCSG